MQSSEGPRQAFWLAWPPVGGKTENNLQGSRLTFQLSSQVASERFDFTSQNKFSLATLFLHNLILCSMCLIFS